MFWRDQWYAAAWGSEIVDKPVARMVCNEAIVLFRRTNGEVAALADYCPHRLLPLSEGHQEGDLLVCRYHGVRIDHEGICRYAPRTKKVGPKFRANTYTVVERYELIWVWIGNPDNVDESGVPAFPWLSDSRWTGRGGMFEINCDFRLLVDNLMDLTHEAAVHSNSIGQPELLDAPFDTEVNGDDVRIKRHMFGVPQPAFQSTYIQRELKTDGPIDRLQDIRFVKPTNVTIDACFAVPGTGADQGDRSRAITFMVLNIITPSTPTRTMYFWNIVRDFLIEDEEVSEVLQAGINVVFAEDVEVLEAQQRAIEHAPEKRMRMLGIDTGASCVRSVIERGVGATN